MILIRSSTACKISTFLPCAHTGQRQADPRTISTLAQDGFMRLNDSATTATREEFWDSRESAAATAGRRPALKISRSYLPRCCSKFTHAYLKQSRSRDDVLSLHVNKLLDREALVVRQIDKKGLGDDLQVLFDSGLCGGVGGGGVGDATNKSMG